MITIYFSQDREGATFTIPGHRGRIFVAFATQEKSILDMTEMALRSIAGLLIRNQTPTEELQFVDPVDERLVRTVHENQENDLATAVRIIIDGAPQNVALLRAGKSSMGYFVSQILNRYGHTWTNHEIQAEVRRQLGV